MAATGCRLRSLLRQSRSWPQLQSRILFSSSSKHRIPPLFSDVPEDRGTGSTVYRHTLKTQRPTTIPWHKQLENWATFIGRVNSPVKSHTTSSGVLFAFTQLRVESPPRSNKFISILLNMWEDMAELSIQHLKLNDCIYVSGYLRSYEKVCDNGNIVMKNTVVVKEVNYIANNDHKAKHIEDGRESALERERKRLHLWQVFFANPYEWRDLRKRKTNPRQPDFRHKSTNEVLWLNQHDPPWILRQLQLQDSRMDETGLFNSRSNLSKFTYNDI